MIRDVRGGRIGLRSRPLGALALSWLVAGAAVAQPSTGPVVTTDLGQVHGVPLGQAGGAFEGIPYATPPVGPLRWRPPQPAPPWSGVREATAFGPSCPQPSFGPQKVEPQSEDCLTINVVTPDLNAKKLPVLVSIHGGAHFVGSGNIPMDGDLWPIVDRGVVVVSPNYRLGWLGFFAHPAIVAESGDGNYGDYFLMDQIAALKWVKRNIARFGGDPDNITVLGCSSGGSSVNTLMVSPAAQGLFNKASIHSGGGLFNAGHSTPEAEDLAKAMAAQLGVTGDGPDAAAQLRAIPVDRIEALEGSTVANYNAIYGNPLLPAPIPVLYGQGRFAHVPLTVSSVSDDASVLGMIHIDAQVLKSRFGVDVNALRPVYGGLDEHELVRQVLTDFVFTSGSLGVAGLVSRSDRDVYAYNFAYVDAAERGKVPGAPHCADMAYMLGGLKSQAPQDQKVAKTMQDYLVNFMRTGDPNGKGLPEWPRYKTPHAQTLVVDDPPRAVTDLRTRQLTPLFDKADAEMGQTIPR